MKTITSLIIGFTIYLFAITNVAAQGALVAEPTSPTGFRDLPQSDQVDNSYHVPIKNYTPSKVNNSNVRKGLEVDLLKMRKKGVAKSLNKVPLIDAFRILDYGQLPKEISVLQMYSGYTKNKQNITTVLQGNLKDFSSVDFFNNYLLARYKSDKLVIGKTSELLGGTLYVHKVINLAKKYNQKVKNIYVGYSQNLVVYSLDIKEVKYWLSNPDASLIHTNESLDKDVFLQVQLKGGFSLNPKEDSKSYYKYQSNIFRKAKAMYFIVSENRGQLFFGALISTKTAIVAKKVAQVLDGIIAVSSLSDEGPVNVLKQKMLDKSIVMYKDNIVRIGTSLKLEDINKYGKNLALKK